MTSVTSPRGDRAWATVSVAVPPERAFRPFTEEISCGGDAVRDFATCMAIRASFAWSRAPAGVCLSQ